MNTKRLLKLADLLEADAKNKKGIKFYLGSWGYVADRKKPASCGTEACAMGLAAISGAFRRAGLDYNRNYSSIRFTWKGRSIDGLVAATELFEITENQAWDLFIPSDCKPLEGAVAERAVAKAIRKLVRSSA